MEEKHLCDYGCGQEAKYQLKNGNVRYLFCLGHNSPQSNEVLFFS